MPYVATFTGVLAPTSARLFTPYIKASRARLHVKIRGQASASGVEALWLAEKLLKHIMDDVFDINCGVVAMHKSDHATAVALKCYRCERRPTKALRLLELVMRAIGSRWA
jgi:hypothetical protein